MIEPYYSGQPQSPARLPVQVVLDNVRSAFNVGSMFRTADAAGMECLHLCGITCWPPHPKLEKTSLGAHRYVRWQRHENTRDALLQLRDQGVMLVALETGPGARRLGEFRWPEPVALVLGHEVVGIDAEVLELCQERVEIPMFGVKNSLNVATAFGIVAYDVATQLRSRGSSSSGPGSNP